VTHGGGLIVSIEDAIPLVKKLIAEGWKPEPKEAK
jgi:hypothetical protein